jgi:hypothetical protein
MTLILSVSAELLILGLVLALAIPAWRHARSGRASGASGWQALEAGLTALVPRPLARLIALEPRLWFSIALWLRRRPRQPGDFTYHQGSLVGMLALASLFSAPVEILLAEALIPWAWLRLTLLIAAIYAVIWVLGFAASLATIPHHLGDKGLSLHYGLLAEAHIPYVAIASVTYERRAPRSGREGFSLDHQTGMAYLSIGGQTSVTLALREPGAFQLLFRSAPPVQRISLAVDDPRDFVAALTERMATPKPVTSEPARLVGG